MKIATGESLILFNRQLASMVGLDLPLPESLRRVGADLQDPRLAKTVAALAEEVERGSSFSEAVAKHGQELPAVYGALVKAGEAGGNLSETLRRAASYEEQMLALSARLQAAMIYPVLIVAGLVALLALFGVVVIPKFGLIFRQFSDNLESFGAELPAPTRIVMWVSELLGHPLSYGVLAAIGLAAYRFRDRLLAWLGRRQFRIPLWNDFVTMVLMARFCNTLGELLARGVGIVEAFLLTRKTMGNAVFEEALAKAAAAVEGGGKVSEALAATGAFPASATWLLGASEERGDLVGCLAELGDYYRKAAERRGRVLASLIEPLVICVLGVIVGTVVISMFLPMFSLGELTS